MPILGKQSLFAIILNDVIIYKLVFIKGSRLIYLVKQQFYGELAFSRSSSLSHRQQFCKTNERFCVQSLCLLTTMVFWVCAGEEV